MPSNAPLRLALAAATVLLGTPCSAPAQTSLSLAAAQQEARARAPEAQVLQARVEGAEAFAEQAQRRLRADPSVSSSYFQGTLIGKPDERAWNVAWDWPVDFSGSWKARAATAAADVDRTRFTQADGLRALDEQVAIAVADLALAQLAVARGERVAALAQIAADAAHRQFDVGQAPQIDVDAADLDLASARLTLAQGRGELQRAGVRLARLLGRESATGLIVDDPVESGDLPPAPDFAALVDGDPRVRAAEAELSAARSERELYERLITPTPTFGVSYGWQRRELPVGAFQGAPFVSGLTANWTDRDLVFGVRLPVPLFDRQREPRARATARMLMAEAGLRAAQADIRSELEVAWTDLQAAVRALQVVAPTATLLDRDAQFVEQAVEAGQFDASTRTLALRRLEDAGRRIDTAVRGVRVARAAWVRRAVALQP